MGIKPAAKRKLPKRWVPDTTAIAKQQMKVELVSKKNHVLRYLNKGYTYERTAEACGITIQEVFQINKEELNKQMKELNLETKERVQQQLNYYQLLMEAYMPAALDGDQNAAMMVVTFNREISRLMGLEAPKKKEIDISPAIRRIIGVDVDRV